MNDCFLVSLVIGGPISTRHIPALAVQVAEAGLIPPGEDLVQHINNDGLLALECDQAERNKFTNLETWLEEHGVEFDYFHRGDLDIISYRRDLGRITRFNYEDGPIVLTQDELVRLCATTLGPPRWALNCQVIQSLKPINFDPKE